MFISKTLFVFLFCTYIWLEKNPIKLKEKKQFPTKAKKQNIYFLKNCL